MWTLNDSRLLWLAIPLVLIASWRIIRARRPVSAIRHPLAGHLPPSPRAWRDRADILSRILFVIGLLLLLLAAARPQAVRSRRIERPDGVAIQMVVDVSGSMAALDFTPPAAMATGDYRTRLDIVKTLFADFVRSRPADRIGLITFGGYAVSRVPPTHDHTLLTEILETVEIPVDQTDALGRLLHPEEQMTAIGDALALACARLNETDATSKIVVLLSDGESNYGIITPDDAIRMAHVLGIRVYTIAVGRDDRVPFLIRDSAGRESLQSVTIGVDRELLQRMAKTTGGQAFHADDARGLADAMATIDALERSPGEPRVLEHRVERMAWPLGLGLLCLLLAVSRRCLLDGDFI